MGAEQRDGGTDNVGAGQMMWGRGRGVVRGGRRCGGGAEGWWGGAVFVGLTRRFSGDVLKQTPPSPPNVFLIFLRAVLSVHLGGGGTV